MRLIQIMLCPFLCGICRTHTKTQFDSLIHLCSHTTIPELPQHCPLCLVPLLHLTLNEHFAQAHEVNCCNQAFVSIKRFLSHLIAKHATFFFSNLSYPVLKNFYQATVQCRPRLLWDKKYPNHAFSRNSKLWHGCNVQWEMGGVYGKFGSLGSDCLGTPS